MLSIDHQLSKRIGGPNMGMIACFQMVDNQCISQLLEKDEDELFEIIEEMQEDDQRREPQLGS